eukprot:sb/3466443/
MNNTTYVDVCNSAFEHYLLIVVVLFVCICGILGNGFVVMATMCNKAFSGDNISIVFVRNLAIADLIYIFVQVIPEAAIRLNGHTWVMGDRMCFISAHAVYIPGAANISFIFTISLYRLLSCIFPFYFRESISLSKANALSGVIWSWSVIPSVMYLCHNTTAVFEPINSDCTVKFESRSKVDMIIAGPWVLLPFIGIIVCNLWLLVIASNAAARLGRSAKQATLTIGVVSGLFVVSWLPYIARKLIIMTTDSEANWHLRPDIIFYELSAFGNPIIYTIVNERFKRYLKSRILGIFRPGQRQSLFVSNTGPPSRGEKGNAVGVTKWGGNSIGPHNEVLEME